MLIDKRIFQLIKGVRTEIFLKIFLEILISCTYIGQAFMLGSLIGDFYSGFYNKTMTFKFMAIIIFMIIRFFLIWITSFFSVKIMGSVRNKLRAKLLNKLLSLGPGFLFLRRSGKIESSLVSGIDYLQNYLILYIPQTIVVIIICSSLLFYLYYIHWILASLGLISLIFCLIAPRVFGNAMKLISDSHWTAYGELNSDLVDGVQGMVTLKSFNRGEDFGKNIKKRMDDLFKKTIRGLKINLLDVFVINLFSTCGKSLILGIGAILFVKNQIGASSLAILLFFTNELFRPVNQLSDYFHQGFMGLTASRSLFEIMDIKEFVNMEGEKEPSKDFVDFQIENLSFKYPETDSLVLKNINLKIVNREHIALVGESGSGKTSILYLLERFFDPTCGDVFYNNVSIKEYNLEKYRRLISMVSQNTYLFKGTIKQNLLLANPKASDQMIVEACKKASIHDDILKLEDKYNSQVKEGGKNFSGGQRQRLSLARAILKNAPILLLDEATSSVDIETEKLIQNSIEEFAKDKTLIIVAHRLNTIINVDKIYVLEKGKVVEKGNHKELMENKNVYYKLFENQNLNLEY